MVVFFSKRPSYLVVDFHNVLFNVWVLLIVKLVTLLTENDKKALDALKSSSTEDFLQQHLIVMQIFVKCRYCTSNKIKPIIIKCLKYNYCRYLRYWVIVIHIDCFLCRNVFIATHFACEQIVFFFHRYEYYYLRDVTILSNFFFKVNKIK